MSVHMCVYVHVGECAHGCVCVCVCVCVKLNHGSSVGPSP